MCHGRHPPLLRAGGRSILAAIAFCVATLPTSAHRGIDEQIAALTVRIEHAPEDAMLYLRRGELHRIHRDWDAARADYEKAGRIDVELFQVDLRLGMMLLDSEQYDDAIGVLDNFVSRRPDDVMGRITRARARVAKEQWLDAVSDYDRALQASEEGHRNPTFYLERARALAAAGDAHVALALRGLDDGIADLNQPVTLQLLAIKLELRRNRYDAALKRLDALAAGSKRQETWSLRRAEIFESAGRLDEARHAYEVTLQAIETLDPGRRRNRAVQRISDAADDGLRRLAPPSEGR